MDWSVWFCFKKQQNPDCAVLPRCWPHHHFSLLLGLNFFPWVPFSFIFPQTFLTKGCYVSTEDGKTASVCPAFYVISSLFDCKENDIHDIQPPSPPPRSISLLLGKNYEAHFLEIHLPDSGVSFHSTCGSWSRLAWQYIKRRASSELKVIEKQFRSKRHAFTITLFQHKTPWTIPFRVHLILYSPLLDCSPVSFFNHARLS